MANEIQFLISGIILGLAAGLSPGPLLALVFSETLRQGKREGIKIAFAPLFSDLPVVIFVFLLLSRLSGYDYIIGAITLFGACYLFYLGVENLKARISDSMPETKNVKSDALVRGIIANLLNPHPYLFWLFIGGPVVFTRLNTDISSAVFFLFGFYGTLVGSKVCVALAVDKSSSFIRSSCYTYIVRALGFVLILFALFFAAEGLRLLGLNVNLI